MNRILWAFMHGRRAAAAPRRFDRDLARRALRGACGVVLLASVSTATYAQTASSPAGETRERVKLDGKRLAWDRAHNILTVTDSVRLRFRDVTVWSDSARQIGPENQEIVYFYDNVHVRDPSIDMWGDLGIYLRPADRADLLGNVVIRDSTGVIHARRASYRRAEGILWLWDDVDFQDAETRVQADSVRYDENERVGEAWGDVRYTELETGNEARGPHGFYDRNTKTVRFDRRSDRRPVAVLHDRDGVETRIFAEHFDTRQTTGAITAAGDVRIVRGATTAEADSAFLYQEERYLELRGRRPSVQQGASTISGREIDVRYGDENVQGVTVRRDARLVQNRSDTLLVREPNVVEGDTAVMYFEGGELERAVITGRGSSTFVPDNERQGRVSLNEASADSIIMLFAEDELEEVIFVGNAQGTYRFYDGDLDSLRTGAAETVVDSVFGVVLADTTRFDFRREAESVQYGGERVLYLAPLNDLHLRGSAEVQYQGRVLKAGTIVFDADTDSLTATERPILIDGNERIYGSEMGYDMEMRDAYVLSGETQYDQGFYKGERIVRNPDGTLQVVNGQYTSCSLDHAHYGFRSRQMKLYVGDKAVARPVTLYLGQIPVMYFPFFFNSVSPGRRSGFLQPNVEFGVGGDSRFIRGLDYYWAASDYWDVLLSSEYNERPRVDRSSISSVLNSADDTRNIKLTTNLRYKVRYMMDGNLRYTRSQDIDSDAKFETWSGRHSQPIGDRMSLRGNLDYASSDQAVLVNNENTDYDRARQQQLTSTLTFQRRGDLANTNVQLNRRQVVNPDERFVDRSVLTTTLPSFSVTFRSIRLAPRPHNPREASAFQRYLSELQFTPNLNFTRTTNNVRRRRFLDKETGVEIPPDSVATYPESLLAEDFYIETFQRVEASTALSLSRQTSLWFMTVSPRLSYSERYVKDDALPDARNFARAITLGARATTTFYGIFGTKVGRLRAMRHSIAPDANYSYAAAVSGLDARQSLNVRLRNQLDVKYEKDGELRRYDGVVNWQLSSSYVPGRGTREWSNVTSSLTLNQQGPLRISVSQVYDPYEGKIISTSVPFGLRLSGHFADYGADSEEEENRIIQEEGRPVAAADSTSPLDQWGFTPQLDDEVFEDRDASQDALGWDLRLSYSLRRERGRTVSNAIGVGASLRPTRKWRITYRASFDSRENRFINPRFTVERDLHCWRASFSRVFRGSDQEWRYYFRIHVIKHQDELFLESGDRGYGGRGYGF